MPDDPSDTAHLLERLRAGDRQALTDLFQRHRDRLRRMVELRMDARLQSRVDASDVLQDAFLDAAARLEPLNEMEDIARIVRDDSPQTLLPAQRFTSVTRLVCTASGFFGHSWHSIPSRAGTPPRCAVQRSTLYERPGDEVVSQAAGTTSRNASSPFRNRSSGAHTLRPTAQGCWDGLSVGGARRSSSSASRSSSHHSSRSPTKGRRASGQEGCSGSRRNSASQARASATRRRASSAWP